MRLHRSSRLGRATALALIALLITALLPWTALAQSGAASGTAAEVNVAPGTPAASQVTVGESTGAVNGSGGIVADSPGSPEDESQDTAVGTASPVRVDGPAGIEANPGSVQSSAPADAGGSDSVANVEAGGSTVGVGEADTQSSADDDGANPSTQNRTEVADVSVAEGLATIGAATSRADVEEAVDGTVRAIGESAITEPSSLLGGLITIAAITASSRSVADGVDSDNVIDFLLTGLALRTAPGGDPLISIDAGPDDDPDLVRVTATIGGLTETFTLPRGSNLLDASSFAGTSVAFATALAPVLDALTGPGGPLEGSELILAGGFSDDGDGTFARGLVEVLRLSGALGPDAVGSIVLGRAFSAADAEPPFSTGTDPDLPPGVTPTSDPEGSFTETREATPAETIFTNPVGPDGDTPDEPSDGGDGPPADSSDLVDTASDAPGDPGFLSLVSTDAARTGDADAGDSSAGDAGSGAAPAGNSRGTALARTGKDLAPVLVIALALGAAGFALRRRVGASG